MTSMFDNCALEYDSNIYVCNPLIQKYRTLPDSPLGSVFLTEENWWNALAFGFVPQDSDYVVVHIVKPLLGSASNTHSVLIGVYSLNPNSWKVTSQDNVLVCGIREQHHVLVEGVAYWLGIKPEGHQIIMCFDTKTDILREISLPDWIDSQVFLTSLFLHPFGQSIAYFVENVRLNHFDMWVLKFDPNNECLWEKKMSVSLSDHYQTKVLGLRNNGEPILFKLWNFFSYDLDSHEAKDWVDHWEPVDDLIYYGAQYRLPLAISPFVESLVLLN